MTHHLIQIDHHTVEWKNKKWPCCIGKNGFSNCTIHKKNNNLIHKKDLNDHDKVEGDKKTPCGSFSLVALLYRADRIFPAPKTPLPLFSIQPNWGWSDDPKDIFYNQLITTPYNARHEDLWRKDSLYDLIIVTNYNWPLATPGKGSAIFIHLVDEKKQYTHGCLGLQKSHFTQLIEECDSNTQWIV
jgi:L,D-peptidoglycan transpeptidase YkuD (ErfK/YbiS/YcfS/YnhG family)